MRIFLGLFVMLVFCAGLSRAAVSSPQSEWASSDYVQARLISGQKSVDDTGPFRAGLQVRIEKGWHAYWRMPGEAGLPPVLDWTSSNNLAGTEFFWPVPQRYNDFGIDSFGYESAVTFPLMLTPERADKPLQLDLLLSIMVCKDICVPQKIRLRQNIPAGEQTEKSRYHALLEKAFAALPHKGDRNGLRLDNVVLGPDALVAVAWSGEGFGEADLYVESGDLYLTAKPEIIIDEKEPRRATLKIQAPPDTGNLAEVLDGRDIALTFVAGDQAIEKHFSF